jgi:hypothetical protein
MTYPLSHRFLRTRVSGRSKKALLLYCAPAFSDEPFAAQHLICVRSTAPLRGHRFLTRFICCAAARANK